VRVAQHQSDHECVAHALGWIWRAMVQSRHALATRHLHRCLARAGELQLQELCTLTAMAAAHHMVTRPDPPMNAGELQLQSASEGAVGCV
jgi:hypothetical protein